MLAVNRGPGRIFDEYLVALSQSGSREALDHLARRWTPRLLRYAARMLGSPEGAKDVVQETWTGALRSLGRLHDPSQFPAWIYSIAHRKCADAVRDMQRGRRLTARAEGQSGIASTRTDPHSSHDDLIDMAAAIGRLTHAQREVVHLFYADDLGIDEISSILTVPAGTVKSRLHAARDALRIHLGESDERHRRCDSTSTVR
jgi:RNA polymerase sigma-70 factor (ECF subfamily)